MKKVVLPEQQAAKLDQAKKATLRQDRTVHQINPLDSGAALPRSGAASDVNKQAGRKDIPISKPLPSVNPSDDVSWVG